MFFLFFLIIDFLIPVIIIQGFNPTAKLAIPTRISKIEAKAEIETQPVGAQNN